MNPRKTLKSARTRHKLIATAERLFAAHGIDAVSLNRIARDAMQRNASVIQYHFGTKEALIAAIFEPRLEQANQRRLELLAGIDTGNRAEGLRKLAEAMVLPMAEHLNQEGGSNYLRFARQVYSNPRLEMFDLIRGHHNSGMRDARWVAQEILSDLSMTVVRHRLDLVTNLIFHSFADRETMRAAGKRTGVAGMETDEFIADLIAMIVSALDAPVPDRQPEKKGTAATSSRRAASTRPASA